MNQLAIMGIIRHILTTLGGAAVAAGHVNADDATAIAGGIAALVGVVWSILDKRK